jgi:hypothetical protein
VLCKLKMFAALRRPLLFLKGSLDLSSIVLRTLRLAHSTICILRDAILKTEGESNSFPPIMEYVAWEEMDKRRRLMRIG